MLITKPCQIRAGLTRAKQKLRFILFACLVDSCHLDHSGPGLFWSVGHQVRDDLLALHPGLADHARDRDDVLATTAVEVVEPGKWGRRSYGQEF